MENSYDVIIAGGGLAGLTTAILLAPQFNVLVIDPDTYPRHKMCGEYLSHEVIPFLKTIGVDVFEHTPVAIKQFDWSSVSGKRVHAKLPLGGAGISRYLLDDLLYQKAKTSASFHKDKVTNASLQNDDTFLVTTSMTTYTCKQFIMATGKRSLLDKNLERPFIAKQSPWLAVKMHYQYEMADDLVQLHNFNGGYAGLSRVENGDVNLCYLATFESFKEFKNINAYNEKVVSQNKHLHDFFTNAQPSWEQPITISQINFDKKSPVENGIIMIGDTAGLIHPLCGNGMAMAIHSAKMASEALIPFLQHKKSRREALANYKDNWYSNFSRRLRYGRNIQKVLLNKKATAIASSLATYIPGILPIIIKKTHGTAL